jgi:hypothetical protein
MNFRRCAATDPKRVSGAWQWNDACLVLREAKLQSVERLLTSGICRAFIGWGEENVNRISERVSFHRYRITVISTWPTSEYKRAALAAAQAALERELAYDQSSCERSGFQSFSGDSRTQ